MLEFEHYWAFFLLLFIPAYFLLQKFSILEKISFPLAFSDWQGRSFQWKHSLYKIARVVSKICGYGAFISLIIAFAGPVVSRQEKIYTSRGAEIVFVVDTSPSMAALDIGVSTRLHSAKKMIQQVVSQMSGTAFGLVAMASEAASMVSATEDHDLFSRQLESLTIGELGDGTAIGIGLSSAIYHLSSSSSSKKCIVLLTDGENNAGDIHPQTATSLAVQSGIIMYTIGIGTTGTVPIEYNDYETGKKYSGFLDSRFDDAVLRKIALETGGQYYQADSIDSLTDALTEIVTKQTVSQSYYYETKKEYHYDFFLLFSLLLTASAWFLLRVYMRVFI